MTHARRGYCVLAVIAAVFDRKQAFAIAKYRSVSFVTERTTSGDLRICLNTLGRHFGN